MQKLSINQTQSISGGDGSVCQMATIEFLNSCQREQMGKVNHVFKEVILSEAMLNVDEQTLKAALIQAIMDADI